MFRGSLKRSFDFLRINFMGRRKKDDEPEVTKPRAQEKIS